MELAAAEKLKCLIGIYHTPNGYRTFLIYPDQNKAVEVKPTPKVLRTNE